MADREQETSSDMAGSAQSAPADSVTVGLVPAPELPQNLAEELPGLFSRRVDDRISWKVEVVTDPLTGGETDASEILDETHERANQQGWECAICLTDLPVLRDKWVVVAAASEERKVGGISIPPLEVTLLRRRVREAILQLVSEMYRGTSEADRDREEKREEADSREARLRGGRPRQLIGHRLTERLAPIRRSPTTGEGTGVDVRFVSPGVGGRLRLLGGMVLSNRPWRIFLAMRTTLATAFASGAFVVVSPSIWPLAFAIGLPRYAALMLLSIVAMVAWIIVAHGLWERPARRGSRRLAELYNTATALTLSMAVLLAYTVLFVLLLVASWVLIPASFLQSNIGLSVGPGAYLILVWVTTSLATVVGTLGSGLESDETVRNATFGHRQRCRFEQSEDDSESEGPDSESTSS